MTSNNMANYVDLLAENIYEIILEYFIHNSHA